MKEILGPAGKVIDIGAKSSNNNMFVCFKTLPKDVSKHIRWVLSKPLVYFIFSKSRNVKYPYIDYKVHGWIAKPLKIGPLPKMKRPLRVLQNPYPLSFLDGILFLDTSIQLVLQFRGAPVYKSCLQHPVGARMKVSAGGLEVSPKKIKELSSLKQK